MSLTQRIVLLVLLLAAGSLAWAATSETAPVNFVGMKPCRIADTRGILGFTGQAGSPALVANSSRTFQVTGTVPGLPAQCGIPTSAVAVSINITVTGFSGAGDLRIYPAGTTMPLASIINFQQENVANSTNLALGAMGAEKGFTVRADGASTQFIADINGYFVPRPMTYLEKGQTERGAFYVVVEAKAAGDHFSTTISFPVPIIGEMEYYIVPAGGATTSNCPGTDDYPIAAPGYVCLYEHTSDNVNYRSAWNPTWSNSIAFGASYYVSATAAGGGHSQGTWAATAP